MYMKYKDKMNEDIFLTTKNAIHQQWMNIPELVNFTPWPTDLTLKEIKPNHIPASTILQKWKTGLNPQTKKLHECICTLTPHVNWQQTYFKEELGRDFLNRYGFFELLGPTGHFHTIQTRAYIAYWDSQLYYPWHFHEAEELYFIISGQAEFELEGQQPEILTATKTCFHRSNQPHALTTHSQPVLALVIWRGSGLTLKSSLLVHK